MPPTPRTRKPVDRMTLSDLETFPIWEYALDEEDAPGQDERTIRPLPIRVVPKGRGSLHVAAEFTSPAGRIYRGFAGVSTLDGKVEILDAVVLVRRRYLPLPTLSRARAVRRKALWQNELRDQALRALRVKETDLFPLRCVLKVPIRGEAVPRRGVVR